MPRRLGSLLWTGAQAAQQAANEALEPLGLRLRHVTVLLFLSHETTDPPADRFRFHRALVGAPPAGGPRRRSQQAIGQALRIDRTTMVSLVDDLERTGLLRRERDPADRRAYVLVLTPAGERARARAERALDERAGAFFASLTSEEQRTLAELLGRLLEARR